MKARSRTHRPPKRRSSPQRRAPTPSPWALPSAHWHPLGQRRTFRLRPAPPCDRPAPPSPPRQASTPTPAPPPRAGPLFVLLSASPPLEASPRGATPAPGADRRPQREAQSSDSTPAPAWSGACRQLTQPPPSAAGPSTAPPPSLRRCRPPSPRRRRTSARLPGFPPAPPSTGPAWPPPTAPPWLRCPPRPASLGSPSAPACRQPRPRPRRHPRSMRPQGALLRGTAPPAPYPAPPPWEGQARLHTPLG